MLSHVNQAYKKEVYVCAHESRTNASLMSIEIEEENKPVMFDDIFDESQSGIMPFWLKVRVQSHLLLASQSGYQSMRVSTR